MSAPRREEGALWACKAGEALYPECLRDTPDPPSVLHGIGDGNLLRPGLAIIGSRRASPYGVSCVRRFASLAAELGIVVISGGATGCDGEAHRSVLQANGATVAVLGCGPDVDYPSSQARTLAQIRERGCVVSELPPGHPPQRWAFPRRNRIIAGLSHAVLVVEAGLPSGTFSTADHALDAGRSVLAVPGSIHASGSAGTNRLIRDGATPITCEDDLVGALDGLLADASAHAPPSHPGRSVDEPVLTALLQEARTPDDLARALGLDARRTLRDLGRLEAAGLVERGPNGTYLASVAALSAVRRGDLS